MTHFWCTLLRRDAVQTTDLTILQCLNNQSKLQHARKVTSFTGRNNPTFRELGKINIPALLIFLKLLMAEMEDGGFENLTIWASGL